MYTTNHSARVQDFLRLETNIDVANFFGITITTLNYYLFFIKPGRNYKKFIIKKRSGGERVICAPASAIKLIQRSLSQVLYEMYRPRPCVTGFRKKMSIVDNAGFHVKKKFILNIDLANFFGTINFGRVRGLFLSSYFNFNPSVATILAQICCFENSLPQGAPTSPVISNMICYRLDRALVQFAKKHNLQYSRYADDLSFSTYLNRFPTGAAFYDNENNLQIGNELQKIINEFGFLINPDKTRLQSKYNRQEVTGLIVNRHINVKRRYVRQIRAMLYAWQQHGYAAAEKEHFERYYKKQLNPAIPHPNLTYLNILKGKFAFLFSAIGSNNTVYMNLIRKANFLSPADFKIPQDALDKLLNVYRELNNLKYEGKDITEIQRGFQLERLLVQLFKYFNIQVKESFKRNASGEQIDGAFRFYNWYYLVECKWKTALSNMSEIDILNAKIGRSGKQTMGCFISIQGWSSKVINLLKQNDKKSIILINGNDIENILSKKIGLDEMLLRKEEALNLTAEPYFDPLA